MASKVKAKKSRPKQPKLFHPPVADIGLAISVEVKKTSEHWSEYVLADGTTLRVKPVISVVKRSSEHYNQFGDPVYQIQAAMIIQPDVPSKLKRKIKKP